MPIINEKYENFWNRIAQDANGVGSKTKKILQRKSICQLNGPRLIKDDEFGHLIYKKGDYIKNQYEIICTLGEGTFGKVALVADKIRFQNAPSTQALKIVKNINKYRQAAKLEINVLNIIKKLDVNNISNCVNMIDWFDYQGHKTNCYQPFHIDQIQCIANQLVQACDFLHQNHITHTDLKPENMLFIDSAFTTMYDKITGKRYMKVKNAQIKLIDFGSATFDHEPHSPLISTRHYRAPEVILDLGWFQSCDMWSIGAILFELYRGFTLFQTHDDREHLAIMERVLGSVPTHMLQKSKAQFIKDGELDFTENGPMIQYVHKHCKPLKDYMLARSEKHAQLYNLMSQLLEYDPYERLTSCEALRHPFFISKN